LISTGFGLLWPRNSAKAAQVVYV